MQFALALRKNRRASSCKRPLFLNVPRRFVTVFRGFVSFPLHATNVCAPGDKTQQKSLLDSTVLMVVLLRLFS